MCKLDLSWLTDLTLSQATGIMADSFHMKTASDKNTLKIPYWRFDT